MILEKILAHKVEEVRSVRAKVPLNVLEKHCTKQPDCRGFEQRLRQVEKIGTAVIAEVKKGSPSKGLIRTDFNPVQIARGYEAAGAACLSVLTDTKFFLGSLDNLVNISHQVSLPLLRKDFIVDPYQIYEARANGADAILLIAAALGIQQLKDYYNLARGLGLDVLMEVHNEPELEAVLQTSCPLVGINNRCLKSFETDIGVTARLIPLIDAERFVVSESGINTRSDIEALQAVGAGAFLVGESLMRVPDYRAKLYELRGVKYCSRVDEQGCNDRA